MKKIAIAALCFLGGVIIGFVVSEAKGSVPSSESVEMASDMSVTTAMNMHAMLEIDPSLPTPEVTVAAEKDTMDGYNLHIVTENYVLTPENVNQVPVQGEGHAHIYVNGVKVARLYGNWFNLSASDLREGKNFVEVTLNANDHSEWVMDGQHISGTVTVVK